MHKPIYQKVIIHLSVFGAAVSLLAGFSDVILGTLGEGIHLLVEVVEMGLDRLVEHFFETDLRETQIIVFYIMIVIGGILIYLVWKLLVNLFKDTGENIKEEYTEFKSTLSTDWQGLSIMTKIIVITIFLLVNYLASFLLF